MKPFQTPSSTKSTTTTEDQSDTRESCYYPGCRKDANCNCEMCLASINATLDLMPMSIQKSSLTKLSELQKPFSERTPIPFRPSILSTPTKSVTEDSDSPILKSTAKSNLFDENGDEKKIKERKSWGFGFGLRKFLVGLCVVFAIDSAFSWFVSEVFQPVLSPEIVRNGGEESWVIYDLNGKFEFLQKHLGEVVDEDVSNCNSVDSSWKLTQDGSLSSSQCVLYKSIVEEVSIWGWPLQNEGLLVSGFSSRSLTILSGGITEWPDGRAGYLIRMTNNSWILGKFSSSVVQMDSNTWFLEYRRNPLLGNPKLSLTVLEFLTAGVSRVVEELKSCLFVFPDLLRQYSYRGADNSVGEQAPREKMAKWVGCFHQ